MQNKQELISKIQTIINADNERASECLKQTADQIITIFDIEYKKTEEQNESSDNNIVDMNTDINALYIDDGWLFILRIMESITGWLNQLYEKDSNYAIEIAKSIYYFFKTRFKSSVKISG